MTGSLFWYDFETTGVDPARDRAIQFAGVRTDTSLNVIGEPVNLFCRPGNDTIPAPGAMQVTGIMMSELQQRGLPETAFIGKIHEAFSVPNTCVTGYNSIRFDDEFTRYTLYRNFLDPYAREWQSGNSRWDVIDLFRMAHALRPEGFEWPKHEDGTPSFRLEQLTAANQISHMDAHDAVSDVLATIDITRKLKAAQPRLYDFLYQLRLKRHVLDQLYPLGKSAVVHVSSMYPARQNCLAVVLPLCVHPGNSNGVICFDLAADPGLLTDLTASEISQRIFTSNAELAAQGLERVPLKTIHINRCPAVAPLTTLRGQEARLGVDLALCQRHMRQLQTSGGVVEKLTEVFAANQFEMTEDPDLMLYQGDFFTAADRETMRELRSLDPARLAGFSNSFMDPRLPEMLFRYRARNFPETLSPEERKAWDDWRWAQWNSGAVLTETRAEINRLQATQGESPCLSDLARYLDELERPFLQDSEH